MRQRLFPEVLVSVKQGIHESRCQGKERKERSLCFRNHEEERRVEQGSEGECPGNERQGASGPVLAVGHAPSHVVYAHEDAAEQGSRRKHRNASREAREKVEQRASGSYGGGEYSCALGSYQRMQQVIAPEHEGKHGEAQRKCRDSSVFWQDGW